MATAYAPRASVRFALVTVMALAAVTVIGVLSWPRLTAARSDASPTVTTEVSPTVTAEVRCPAATHWPSPIPQQSKGDLTPLGATGATLCTYALPHETTDFPLTERAGLVRSTPDDLIGYLNGLPLVPIPVHLPGTSVTNMCTMMDTSLYVIVLHYADRDRTVQILPTCGIVWTDAAARRYPSLKKLLSFFGS